MWFDHGDKDVVEVGTHQLCHEMPGVRLSITAREIDLPVLFGLLRGRLRITVSVEVLTDKLR